jgi:plasmid stabilization system protein ParE
MSLTEVIWSKNAIRDIEKATERIAEKSQKAALGLAERLLDTEKYFLGKVIVDGPILPTKSSKHLYRYFINGEFKIVYHRKKNKVYISAVFNCLQHPSKLKL